MKHINDPDEVQQTTQTVKDDNVTFTCPNCKEISRDNVIFLCNTCRQDELIYQNGIYMCPACLLPGENFECLLCGSKEVTMKRKKK